MKLALIVFEIPRAKYPGRTQCALDELDIQENLPAITHFGISVAEHSPVWNNWCVSGDSVASGSSVNTHSVLLIAL